MFFLRMIAVAACFFAGGLVSADKAFAASSGWMDSKKTEKFYKSVLLGKVNIPTSIRCKNNPTVKGMSLKNTMIIFEYRLNPKKQNWRWAWGAGFVGSVERRYGKRGYVKVSSDSFRRKSGLVIPCAIWHQKRKK